MLPRCYQDRTNQPHLPPSQKHHGLWFLVGLGRLRLGYWKFVNPLQVLEECGGRPSVWDARGGWGGDAERSCGHHYPVERDFPRVESSMANPLKSRWGHQHLRDQGNTFISPPVRSGLARG